MAISWILRCRSPIAVQKGDEEVVRELLAAGASVSNTRESFMRPGQNLLSVVAYQNREGTIDDLVAAGADLGKDRKDCLPLMWQLRRVSAGRWNDFSSPGQKWIALTE